MFEPLDPQTPQLALLLGIVFAIAGMAILAHSRWRQKRQEREATRRDALYEGKDSRIEGPDAPFDAKREGLAGLAVLVLGAVSILYAVYGNIKVLNQIDDNVNAKYPEVVEVDGNRWRGHVYESDITTQDGETITDVRIYFEPATGEPTIYGEIPGITIPDED